LIHFLASPETAGMLAAKGMEPPKGPPGK